eukprot:153402-Pyramimonas_sp.AAC.1
MLYGIRQHGADHLPRMTETSGRHSTAASAWRSKIPSHFPNNVDVAVLHPAAVVESRTDCGAPERS